jgi:hypothetical protein
MAYATINNGASYFDTTAYTANGGSQTITNSGSMKPDLVWTKARSTTSNNIMINAIAGASKYLYSNSYVAEVTDANYLTSFNSNGFSVGSNNYSNGTTIVAWQWLAANSTTTNTSGTISSTVSANTTSGFSVVTYAGSASNATVGHGLGIVPKMILIKDRTVAYNWQVYHASLGAGKYIEGLNTTAAASTGTLIWQNTTPTSSIFYLGGNVDGSNKSGSNQVAYCFAEVKGYSKFGSYTGNGNTSGNGTFVYLGFKPKFIMIKRSDTAGFGWYMRDTARDTYNVGQNYLDASSSGAEGSGTPAYLDYLSNGFKLTNTSASDGINASGGTYIYMAFAENPFVLTDGTPVTAR